MALDMHNRILILIASCVLFSTACGQHARAAGSNIDCSNPSSSVESAVCGDPDLLKSYKFTEATYDRVRSNPAALDAYLDLLHRRAACVKPKYRQSYKLCILESELLAYCAFSNLGQPQHAADRRQSKKVDAGVTRGSAVTPQ